MSLRRPIDLRRFYPIVAERAGHRCEFCRAPEVVFPFRLTVDHVIPKSRGGLTSLDNLALCCPACQQQKLAFETGWNAQEGTEEPLFNPRRHRWSKHFAWSEDGTRMIGLTRIGRATIERLSLNDGRHVAARAVWLRLPELFP